MEPENGGKGGLEDDVPLKNWVIFRFHVNFQWCNCVFYMHPFRIRRRFPVFKDFSPSDHCKGKSSNSLIWQPFENPPLHGKKKS